MAEDAGRTRAVVAGLDGSPASAAVLDVAAALAGWLGARLEARYVEEDDWLAAAALPCTRWVAAPGGAGRPLTPDQVELTWRAAVTRLRSALDARTGAMRVQWSLEVVRGRVWAVLGETSQAADVLVLGSHGWQGDGQRLGSVARTALAQCTVPLALVPAAARRPGRAQARAPARWVALLDTPADAGAVLELAAALAAGGAPLELWCLPELAATARAGWPGDAAPPLHVLTAPLEPGRLPAALLRGTGVVLGRASALAAPGVVPALLGSGLAALVLVGAPPPQDASAADG